jgi:hypothetical protein
MAAAEKYSVLPIDERLFERITPALTGLVRWLDTSISKMANRP